MAGRELLATMQSKFPKIQLRDIWRILQNLEAKGLVFCLTPGEVTGRLYFFTEKGRRWMRKEFNFPVNPLPKLVNWKKYSCVVRGQTRKAVLMEVGGVHSSRGKPEPKTITKVRKQLLIHKHPMGLSAAIRAMHELEELKLVRCVGLTKKRNSALYLPTITGNRIIKQLSTKPENQASEPFDGNGLVKASPLIINGKEKNQAEEF